MPWLVQCQKDGEQGVATIGSGVTIGAEAVIGPNAMISNNVEGVKKNGKFQYKNSGNHFPQQL